jgi:hypothetical protein
MLLLIIAGTSLAGTWDFNPGMYALKHTHEFQDSVEGQGYMMEYQKINTNNLSLLEYTHGSGSFKQAEILNSSQKTTHDSDNYYVYSAKNGWVEKPGYANSEICFTKQSESTQSPTSFAYGTGWYASHPVEYNSLLKDKTEAKSYQEASSMNHQLEYARGYIGDISVVLNCTGPTEDKNGVGLTSMKILDDVTQGTVHVGELQTDTLYSMKDAFQNQGWKDPLIEIDTNYIGNFHIEKVMELNIEKEHPSSSSDWLPCCSGGYFDIQDYKYLLGGAKGVFDCTCRNTSISTYIPAWNGTAAQFPTEQYKSKP